ncbi:MAG: phage terminase large subunit family protein [Oscillospiraceae bacterium]|nr:phage terminase large subunit family protein [Oscillospiraceae bacterium]
MTITEKAAYLKGLVEGQGLDPEDGAGKLWRVLSELVSDLASQLTELQNDHEDVVESIEELNDELDFIEELLDEGPYDDDEDDGYYPFGDYTDGDDDSDDDIEDDMTVSYEVECPNCGESFSFDEETLENGSIPCPKCGTPLEFDLPF